MPARDEQLAAIGFQPLQERKLDSLGFVPEGAERPMEGSAPPVPGLQDLELTPESVEEAMKDPGVAQTVARLLTMPGRGFRGMGVLMEQILRREDLAKAFERASAATEPGFEAQEGERAGATAGQLVGDAPLFTALAALMGPAAGALRLGPTAAAAAEAGTAVGGAKALEDLSAKGETSARDIAIPAVLGMLLGAGASKASRAVKGLVDDATRFTPEGERALAQLEKPVADAPAAAGERAQSALSIRPGTGTPAAAPKPPAPGRIEPPPSGPLPETAPPPEALQSKAGNISLAKLKTTDDAKRIIQDVEEEFSGMIELQRRGRVPWEKTEQSAALLGLTPEKMAKLPGGRASSAAGLEAQKSLVAKSAEEVSALRRVAAEDDSTENLIKFMLAFRRHATMQKVFSGQVAEAGRALNILGKTTGPADIETQNLKGLLEVLGGRDFGEDLLRRLSQIDPKDTFAVNRFIREAGEASTMDKLYEAWINGLLSSPLTHKVNSISNALFAVSRIPERLLRSAVDRSFSAFTGQRTAYAGEAAQDAFGMVRGLGEGVRRALHVLRYGMSEAQATKLDMRTMEAIKGTLGSVIRLPGKFLTAEDEFFKAVTGIGERSALAYRFARKEGLSGEALQRRIAELEANPTPEMLGLIRNEELYRTFQDKLGKAGSLLVEARNEIPLLRWVLPFLRTPVNIAKRSLERTPMSAFNIAYKALRREGPYAQEEAVKDLSNMAMGSMIAASAAYYAATDRLTGRAPRKPSDKDAFYRTGKQPYSLKIGDSWYSYDRLEPWSMAIGLVADAVQEARDVGTSEAVSPMAAAKALTVIPRNLTSKTFLSGISDAFDALSDPDRYGERWISRFAGSLLPFSGALRFAAQVEDATIRKPETFQQAVMANLPVLSELVPARRNVFGEPVERPNDVFSMALVRKTKEVHTKLEDELQRLEVGIGFPSNRISGHKLSQDQYGRYLEESGRLIKDKLSELLEKPNWDRLSDEERRKEIDRTVRQARALARVSLKTRYAELADKGE